MSEVDKVDEVAAVAKDPSGSGKQRGPVMTAQAHSDPAVSPTPGLAQIYREHADFVWRVLHGLGVPDAHRDDAFHEVFMVVHRRLADYDGRASMSTWLFGITRNVVLHHRRSQARHLRRVKVAPEPLAGPGPDELIAHAEARALIERFLETLSEDHRVAFVLAEIEGLKVPEMAEQLGANLNTLYSRIHTARKQFHQFLAQARDADTGGRHGPTHAP